MGAVARKEEREMSAETERDETGETGSGDTTETQSREVTRSDSDETQSREDDSREKAQLDRAAESFVEVEQVLGHLGEGMTTRGQAIDVARVPASEVPEEFPYEIGTDDVLALTLELVDGEGQTVRTYFEWPESGTDDRLARLLDLCEISVDRFADLHGTDILLRVEGGYYVPALPEEKPRGDPRAIYGILAGIAPSITIALFSFFGLGSVVASGSFFLLWVVCTFILLPIAIYVDAWNLRTTTDWDGGPLFWAFFALIPALNVLVVPAYLIMRENAQPVV